MKILLDFTRAAPNKNLLFDTFYTWIIKPLQDNNVDFSLILARTLFEQIKTDEHYKNCHFYPLNMNEFHDKNFTGEKAFQFLYSGVGQHKMIKIKQIFINALQNVEVDIVISFEFGNCVLKEMYPNALHLILFGGLWRSGSPDFSVTFDPINSVSYSSLIKFKDEINNFQINAIQNNKIEKLKKIYKEKIIKTGICRKELLRYRKKYKKLILLPLQLQSFLFANEADFKSQSEYFNYVVNKIPSDIGIVVTGHLANLNEIKEIIKNNASKYKNIIILDELLTGKYAQSSLYVLPYVDGIINVCSTLVLKALLADVRIFSLGRQYSSWCQDFQGLENIEENLNKPIRNKNNILYWYLTHYDFWVRKVISPNWLYNFLVKKLQKSRHIRFSFFDEVVDIDEVISFYNNTLYASVVARKKRTLNDVWHFIFKQEETERHKVINLLGIKIKYKKK